MSEGFSPSGSKAECMGPSSGVARKRATPLPQDDIMQSNLGVAGPCFVAFAKRGTWARGKRGALARRQWRKISEGFGPGGSRPNAWVLGGESLPFPPQLDSWAL